MDEQFWAKFESARNRLWKKAWWLSWVGVAMIIGAAIFLAMSILQLIACYKMHTMPKGNHHSQKYLQEQFDLIMEDLKEDEEKEDDLVFQF